MADLVFAGYKWKLMPSSQLTKEEIEMLGNTLPLMERWIHEAVDLLNKFNNEGLDDFAGEIFLDTVRSVHSEKDSEGRRTSQGYIMEGKDGLGPTPYECGVHVDYNER